MTTLETVEYVDTFRKLKLKHDQEKDRQENKPEMSVAYVFSLSLSLSFLLPPTPLISKQIMHSYYHFYALFPFVVYKPLIVYYELGA